MFEFIPLCRGRVVGGSASSARSSRWEPHIPSNLVVDHWTSAVESSSPLDFLSLYAIWTPFGRLINYKIMSTISVACDFTTKSGGIWTPRLRTRTVSRRPHEWTILELAHQLQMPH